MAQIATVATITGKGSVFAVNEQGVSRQLKAGDVLQKGETIRTVGDVQVELRMDDGRPLAVAPNQTLRLDDNVTQSDQRPTAQDSAVIAPAGTADTVIQALERGTDLSTQLEATAAGLGGGAGADGGNTFVQLLRIVEGVDPLAYAYEYKAPDLLPDLDPEPGLAPADIVASITIDPITGDNILNADEAKQPFVTITGTVGGDVKVGDIVTLTINGKDYTGPVTVDANGKLVYSIPVETASLKADNTIDAKVSTTDAAGNTATAYDTGAIQLEGVSISVAVDANGANTTVHEAGLTSDVDGREINRGSFDIATNLGVATVTIGGTSFTLEQLNALSDANPSAAIDTGEGWMRITGFVGSNGDKAGTISFTYELKAALNNVDDPTTEKDEGASFLDSVAVSVTGIGGTVANASIGIDIVDDVPTVTVNAAAEGAITLTTQDAQTTGDASDTASASFAAALLSAAVPAYGADGAGSTVIGGYTLNVTNGTASGLLSHGESIVLNKNEVGEVVGSTANGGNIFKISVDANGLVTLTQYSQIDHVGDGNGAQIALAEGKVSLSATVTTTDGDWDTATATVSADLGGNIRFDDDVPSITVSATAEVDALLVDETALGTNATANFADNFTSTPTNGADGATVASVYALSAVAGNSGLVDTASGQNVVLSLNAGVVEGRTATGGDLVFTVSVNASGTVELDQIRAVKQPTGGASHDEATTLNAANLITLTRTDTITDGDLDTASSSASIYIGTALSFKDDGPAISVTLTTPTADALVVDETALGTNATANFADNFTSTPTNGADGATVASVYALSAVAGNSGLVDTASGQNVVLSLNAGVVEGRTATGGDLVFTVSVNASGTVELDQIRAVKQPTGGASHDEATALTAANLITLTRTDTITDGDLDTASSSASINIGTALSFNDDGPNAQVVSSGAPASQALALDETNLTGASIATSATSFAGHFVAGSAIYGTDGAATSDSVTYGLSLSGTGTFNSGFQTLAGVNIVLSLNTDTGAIEGKEGSTTYFTITVNNSGEVVFTQLENVKHATTTDHDDTDSLSLTGDQALVLTQTVTDADGDTDTASVNLSGANAVASFSIDDDGPNAQVVSSGAPASQALALDETNLTGASIATSATSFAGHFVAGSAIYGTDGAATSDSVTYGLSLSGTGTFNSGFQTLAGVNIVLSLNTDTGAIEGKEGSTTYFTITVNNSGEVVFTQLENVKHATTTDHDDTDSLSLTGDQALVLTQTVTDADGDTDTASVNLSGANAVASFSIDDDGPNAQVVSSGAPASQALALDETNLTGASIATSATSFAGHFVAGSAIYGTDGAATSDSVTYGLSLSGTGTFNSGFQTLAGVNIVLSLNTDTGAIEGKEGSTTYFTITVNNSGEVVFTQLENVKHATTTDHDDTDSLSLTGDQALVLTQTVTDADGDTDTASVNLSGANAVASFSIDDDGPNAQVVSSGAPASQALALDETNLTGASIATSATSFAGHFVAGSAIYGTDGAATSDSVTYGLSLSGTGTFNSGFQTLAGVNIVLSLNTDTGAIEGKEGSTTYFTITVNNSGEVVFTQLENVKHATTTDHDDTDSLSLTGDQALVLTQTVTDADGDTDTASVNLSGANAVASFSIDDDGPNAQVVSSGAPASQALALDETNLTGASIATSATSFAGHFVAGSAIYGTDGAATSDSVTYGLSLSGTGTFNSGFQTLAGVNIVLSLNTDTGAIEGKEGSTTYFTITVNNSGEVVFTQLENVKHATTTDHDDTDSLSLTGDQALVLTQTVTDADGDTDTASVNLSGANAVASFSIDDDGPNAQVVSSGAPASQALALDETNLTGASIATSATSFAGHFVAGSAIYGTDGAATSDSVTYGLSLSGTGTFNSGFQTLAGVNIVLSLNTDTGAIEGKEGSTTYFTITVNNSGEVVFTQLENVKHATTTDHDDTDSLSLTGDQALVLTQTVTDADGDTDTASVNLSGANAVASFSIDDDGPNAQVVSSGAPASQALALDETNLTGASIATSATSFAGHFVAGSAIYGTDGAATSDSVTYGLSLSGTGTFNSGFQTLAGVNIVLSLNTDTGAIEGKEGSTTYFTITVNNSGEVVFTQLENVKHATTTDHDDTDSLSLTGDQALVLTQTVTDADGDTDTASVNLSGANAVASFSIDDDGPDASAKSAVTGTATLDETGGLDTVTIAAADIVGLFNAPAYGTDGPGLSTTYKLSATNGAQTGLWLTGHVGAGNEILLVKVSDTKYEGREGGGTGTLAFTVTIDSGTGAVTVTQNATLEHTTDGSTLAAHDDSLSPSVAAAISVTQTVTDADGDTDSATSANALAISFKDDGPSLSATGTTAYNFRLDEMGPEGSSAAAIGDFTFNAGADAKAFSLTNLEWIGKSDSTTFTQNGNVWIAKDGANDLFSVKIIGTTYEFQLLSPIAAPTSIPTGNVMEGITGGSGLDDYTLDSSLFGNAFDIRLDGVVVARDGTRTDSTLTISNTELGVAGNANQADEHIIIDLVQKAGYENASVTSVNMSLGNGGSLKPGDTVYYVVKYVDGSTSGTLANPLTDTVLAEAGNPREPGIVYINGFTPGLAVAEIEVWTSSQTWKVDGLSFDYALDVTMDDAQYEFKATAVDGDGDSAAASFTVIVGTGTAGDDILVTQTGDDQVSAGAGADIVKTADGDDTLIGGAGNDTLTGGAGADVFKWSFGDQGTTVTPAIDHITDFSKTDGDKLNLADLLQGENSGNLSHYLTFATESGRAVLNVSTTADGGVVQKVVFDNFASVAALEAEFSGVSGADLIAKMKANGNLITD